MMQLNWRGFFGVLWGVCAVVALVFLDLMNDKAYDQMSAGAKAAGCWIFVWSFVLAVIFGACQQLFRRKK